MESESVRGVDYQSMTYGNIVPSMFGSDSNSLLQPDIWGQGYRSEYLQKNWRSLLTDVQKGIQVGKIEKHLDLIKPIA